MCRAGALSPESDRASAAAVEDGRQYQCRIPASVFFVFVIIVVVIIVLVFFFVFFAVFVFLAVVFFRVVFVLILVFFVVLVFLVVFGVVRSVLVLLVGQRRTRQIEDHGTGGVRRRLVGTRDQSGHRSGQDQIIKKDVDAGQRAGCGNGLDHHWFVSSVENYRRSVVLSRQDAIPRPGR